jgi:hypothetical protein
MDMHSRTQYLKRLQQRYFQCHSKKEKTSILDEFCKNTGQNRKYVISRINSSFSSRPKKRKWRKRIYDGYVKAALAKIWDIFDEPCGQRLAPLLKTEVDRLRQLEEIFVSNEIAEKLKRISPRTVDRALKHQRQVLHLNRKYRRKRNPLIYQKIPVKAGGWDRTLPGQVQVDLVEHCGQSASGLYGNTVSCAEVAFGWWEGEVVLGSGQERSCDALDRARKRMPFRWVHAHPDNDSSFINWHLLRYCEAEGIEFSRSRPYKKNDNNFVEQKNSTHVRAVIGHLRYDTEKELALINSLYRNELRLYKNFFQPVMKLKEKIRDKGKVHRRYDTPKTPYQRIMKSEHISEETKDKLTKIYLTLNPAELKRGIDEKVHRLFKAYEAKNRGTKASPSKKQTPRTVRSYMTQQ